MTWSFFLAQVVGQSGLAAGGANASTADDSDAKPNHFDHSPESFAHSSDIARVAINPGDAATADATKAAAISAAHAQAPAASTNPVAHAATAAHLEKLASLAGHSGGGGGGGGGDFSSDHDAAATSHSGSDGTSHDGGSVLPDLPPDVMVDLGLHTDPIIDVTVGINTGGMGAVGVEVSGHDGIGIDANLGNVIDLDLRLPLDAAHLAGSLDVLLDHGLQTALAAGDHALTQTLDVSNTLTSLAGGVTEELGQDASHLASPLADSVSTILPNALEAVVQPLAEGTIPGAVTQVLDPTVTALIQPAGQLTDNVGKALDSILSPSGASGDTSNGSSGIITVAQTADPSAEGSESANATSSLNLSHIAAGDVVPSLVSTLTGTADRLFEGQQYTAYHNDIVQPNAAAPVSGSDHTADPSHGGAPAVNVVDVHPTDAAHDTHLNSVTFALNTVGQDAVHGLLHL